MVEPVISSRVTWRDYSKKKKKRRKHSHMSKTSRDLSHWTGRHLPKCFTRHCQNHLWLETLWLKSCGDLHLNGLVSAWHRNNNKCQLMFMLPYTGRRGMPGHGGVITILIFREGLSTSTASFVDILKKMLDYTEWSVSTETTASTVDVVTFFTTAFYLSKQCVNLLLGSQWKDHLGL